MKRTAGTANQRTARQGEVRGETTHRGKEHPVSPETSKNPCRFPARGTRAEAGEVIKTIPTIDFKVETVEYQSFTVQKDTEVIHGIKGGTKDQLLPEGEPVRIFRKTSTEGLGEETLGTQSSRQVSSETATQKVQKTEIMQVRA